ncbi:MAG: SHOCT domain-containing protein [Rubrobacteraceae bacterium]
MGMPGPTELLIVLFLVVVGIVVLLVLMGGRRGSGRNSAGDDQDARQILDERYARGELGDDEYRQMRQNMES